MKYKVKEDVWQDKVTGQRYTKDYAFRHLVNINEQGEIIKGHVFSPYGVAPGIDLIVESGENFGYPAYCFGQKMFLTDAQVEQRFEYLGKLEREEDIGKDIKEYSEENCDFENLEWLAQMTLRDLTHRDNGGLSQCVHAKLLEFLLKNAPESEKMKEIKKIYFNDVEVEQQS